MRWPLALLIGFLTLHSYAQQAGITGKLIHADGHAVGAASVALSNPIDSSLIAFTISKSNGGFAFEQVDTGDYLLVVAAFGHEVIHHFFRVDSPLTELELKLQSSAISLEEVMVQAKHIPILFQQDTVVYNANSFKVGEQASVEDLIRKLPGLQVDKDGNLLFEGQKIGKVLVNGNEFFGGNVRAATRNLDADMVDKIEVIDRKTEEDDFTGDEGESREKVINLVLKKEVAQGVFGTLRAAYGSKEYYDAKGALHFFRNTTQLSVIGGGNNMDEDLFDWGDVRTLQSFGINPFDDWQSMSWWSAGIESPKGLGMNLHSEIGKVKSDLSYVRTSTTSLALNESYSEVYLPGRTIYSSRDDRTDDDLGKHQFNARLVYQPDTIHRLSFRAQLNLKTAQANSTMLQSNILQDREVLNSGFRTKAQEGQERGLDGKISYLRNSKRRKGNYISLSAYVGTQNLEDQQRINNETRDSVLLSLPHSQNYLLSQRLKTSQLKYATTLRYNYQLNEKISVSPGLDWSKGGYEHDFEWRPTDEAAIPELSPVGTVDLEQLQYSVGLHWKMDSFTSLWFTPRVSQVIEDRSFTTDSLYRYDYHLFYPTPRIFLNSSKAQKYRLNAAIYGDLQKPNIRSILPITDNTQPYSTRIGNIRLQNYMTYYNYINYTYYFGLEHYLSIYTWNNLQANPISNEQQLDDANFSVLRPINLRYASSSYNNISYAYPFPAFGRVGLGLSYNYSNQFSIINLEDVRSVQNGWSTSLTFHFTKAENWGAEVNLYGGRSSGAINGKRNNAYTQGAMSTELQWNPIDRWSIETSLYWQYLGSNGVSDATNIPIWSLESDLYIDPGKHWAVGLQAFDLLNRSTELDRNWTANSFMESRSNVLTQYLLLRLTYKIKKAGEES